MEARDGSDARRRSQAKECRQPPEARRSSMETDLPLAPREEAWPCQHLGFGLVKLISDYWPPELKDNKFVLFKPPSLW